MDRIDVNNDTPMSRNEELLFELIKRHADTWQTVEGAPPITLPNAKAQAMNELMISGNVKRTIEIDGTSYDVPDGYTMLDYIQSSGTQYINTGVSYNTATDKAIAEIKFNTLTSGYQGAIGGRDLNTTANASGLYLTFNNVNVYMESGRLTTGSDVTRYSLNTTDWHTFKWDGLNPYINDVRFSTYTYNTYEASAPIYLFAANTLNKTSEYGSVSIKSFKYYRNSSLILALIPAKRTSDNVLGMYDFVTNTFFTNAGTGTFTAGTEAPCPDLPEGVVGVGDKKYLINGQYYDEPDDITFLDYVEQDGTASYVNTGIYLNTATSKILYDGYETTAFSIWGTAANSSYWGITGSSMKYRADYCGDGIDTGVYYGSTRHILLTVANKCYVDGELKAEKTIGTYTINQPLYLFARCNSSGTVGDIAKNARCYAFGVWVDGTNASIYYQPAMRNSDGIVGFYDVINSTFVAPTSGALVPGNKLTPCYQFPTLKPENCGVIDLGTLSWTYRSDIATGEFVSSSLRDKLVGMRNVYISNSDYSLSNASDPTGLQDMEYCGHHATNGLVYIRNTGYTDATAFKASLSGVYLFYQRTTDTSWTAPTTHTAYADEPLLKIGNYADVLKAIEGKIDRIIGKKSFDGTESWTYDSTYNRFRTTISDVMSSSEARTLPAYCTHFKMLSNQESVSSIVAGQAYFGATNATKYLYFHASQTSASDWTTWCAANNPTIYYIKAAATTETISAQAISTAEGTNYIDVLTEVKPSNVKAVYRKKSGS